MSERASPPRQPATCGKPLKGTRALAAAKGALGECEARFNALVRACTTRCDRLIDALERLPEAATVDPLAADPTEVSRRNTARRKNSAQRNRKPIAPLPVKGIGTNGTLGKVGEAVLQAARSAQDSGESVSVAKGRLGEQLAAKRDDRTPRGSPDVGSVASAGNLVLALLETRAAPKVRAGKAQTAVTQATSTASRMLGLAGEAVAKAAAAGATKMQAPSPVSRDRKGSALGLSGKSMLQTGSASAVKSGTESAGKARTTQTLMQALMGSAGTPALGGLTQGAPLIGKLLAELAAQAPQKPRRNANPPPSTAPRARSRLLQAANQAVSRDETASRPRREQPTAPESDHTDNGEAGTELAGSLNRLLLDQAWLRGVDLT